MSNMSSLLTRIEAYCAVRGIAESTFGRIAVNDGKFVARLRAGGSMTLRTLDHINDVLSNPSISSPDGPQPTSSPAATPADVRDDEPSAGNHSREQDEVSA